jgi:hypothetical protein
VILRVKCTTTAVPQRGIAELTGYAVPITRSIPRGTRIIARRNPDRAGASGTPGPARECPHVKSRHDADPRHALPRSTANYLAHGGPACGVDLGLQRLGRRGELYPFG